MCSEFLEHGFALKVRTHSWTGSVQGTVATWSMTNMRYFLTILDPSFYQVATAPCTDCVQVRFLLLRQSPGARRLSTLNCGAKDVPAWPSECQATSSHESDTSSQREVYEFGFRCVWWNAGAAMDGRPCG